MTRLVFICVGVSHRGDSRTMLQRQVPALAGEQRPAQDEGGRPPQLRVGLHLVHRAAHVLGQQLAQVLLVARERRGQAGRELRAHGEANRCHARTHLRAAAAQHTPPPELSEQHCSTLPSGYLGGAPAAKSRPGDERRPRHAQQRPRAQARAGRRTAAALPRVSGHGHSAAPARPALHILYSLHATHACLLGMPICGSSSTHPCSARATGPCRTQTQIKRPFPVVAVRRHAWRPQPGTHCAVRTSKHSAEARPRDRLDSITSSSAAWARGPAGASPLHHTAAARLRARLAACCREPRRAPLKRWRLGASESDSLCAHGRRVRRRMRCMFMCWPAWRRCLWRHRRSPRGGQSSGRPGQAALNH